MLFVTFHGGKPNKHRKLNNIHAYDKNGKLITASLLDNPHGILLDELRAIRLRGKLLYVVNANQTQNSVLCYRKKGKGYTFVSTFVSRKSCPAILHPFDLTFDKAGYCYLSSQDTNVVTRLKVSNDGQTATPAPLAPALPKTGTFLKGTFVASSVGTLSTPATTPVTTSAGLAYSAAGAKKHSVRGVLWIKNALYVVDQPAGRVKVYDADGKLIGQSNEVKEPVHLSHHKSRLYLTGGNQVLTAKLPKKPGDFMLEPVSTVKIKNTGGLVLTRGGQLYLASRTGNFISKFDRKFKPLAFASLLPDNPEFLLHTS